MKRRPISTAHLQLNHGVIDPFSGTTEIIRCDDLTAVGIPHRLTIVKITYDRDIRKPFYECGVYKRNGFFLVRVPEVNLPDGVERDETYVVLLHVVLNSFKLDCLIKLRMSNIEGLKDLHRELGLELTVPSKVQFVHGHIRAYDQGACLLCRYAEEGHSVLDCIEQRPYEGALTDAARAVQKNYLRVFRDNSVPNEIWFGENLAQVLQLACRVEQGGTSKRKDTGGCSWQRVVIGYGYTKSIRFKQPHVNPLTPISTVSRFYVMKCKRHNRWLCWTCWPEC